MNTRNRKDRKAYELPQRLLSGRRGRYSEALLVMDSDGLPASMHYRDGTSKEELAAVRERHGERCIEGKVNGTQFITGRWWRETTVDGIEGKWLIVSSDDFDLDDDEPAPDDDDEWEEIT